MKLLSSVEKVYQKKERLIILGLTGQTGAGCSTVAKILKTNSFSKLHLRKPPEYKFANADERKYDVIYKYMAEPTRWIPFVTIEVSSIILAFVLQSAPTKLIHYLQEIVETKEYRSIEIGDLSKVIDTINGMEYMFAETAKLPLTTIDESLLQNPDRIAEYYDYYINKLNEYKSRFKIALDNFSCYEITESKLAGKKLANYHLYTFLMQNWGNNIRCSGEPYSDTFDADKFYTLPNAINNLIKIIIKHDENLQRYQTRICIDAIRNPFEARYFHDRYRSFYLLSINTETEARKERLKNLNNEEFSNLDKIEYPSSMPKPEAIFYHQNIQSCLEIADIHIYNQNVSENKYYDLTTQLLKYLALMIHPGLVTPTSIERCMQLAYNAKYNSGCLSRQVGAVVTRADYSIQSVGWNDVPKGQISCNLRDVSSYNQNRDQGTYSEYEICDNAFCSALEQLDLLIQKEDTKGRKHPYCFKDIYNGITGKSNQVYTRALHAEENAFLQISKYGGTHVKEGILFTTASPCELCAKKAYQLGIKHIYYIDPYPGISKTHILNFGKDSNPEMHLFFGAIGEAYLSLYTPRIATKDELSLITGIDCKDAVSQKSNKPLVKTSDMDYTFHETIFSFDGNREKITCTRNAGLKARTSGIKEIQRTMVWTGGSYDGTKLANANFPWEIEDIQEGERAYSYKIKFGRELNIGEEVNYSIVTNVKDEQHVMQRYVSQIVRYRTEELRIILKCPKNLITNVRYVEYADIEMKEIFSETIATKHEDSDETEIYTLERTRPNLFYTYSIEWDWV